MPLANLLTPTQKKLSVLLFASVERFGVSRMRDLSFICETWHATHDTWHMTHDTLHVTHERWGEVHLLSKCQLPCSYGLGGKVFWRFGGKGWLRKAIIGIKSPPVRKSSNGLDPPSLYFWNPLMNFFLILFLTNLSYSKCFDFGHPSTFFWKTSKPKEQKFLESFDSDMTPPTFELPNRRRFFTLMASLT